MIAARPVRATLVLVALLLQGCFTTPEDAPRFRPVAAVPSDHAVLYIYRPHTQFNYGGYPDVSVGREAKFALTAGGYRPFLVQTGDYEIKAECGWGSWYPPTTARTLSVRAGEEYFVRVVPSPTPNVSAETALDPNAKPPAPSPFGACRVGRTLITLVPKQRALSEIAQTRLLAD